MSWVWENRGLLTHYTGQHLYLALTPVAIGLIISLPLGIASVRWRWLYPPALSASTVLYSIPALALFIFLIPYTGLIGPASSFTLIIPLALFSVSVLLPNVVDGLRSVPEPVRQSATAMGFGPLRQLVSVELPLALPVVIAGLRVATVASISLVSVGALIGIGGLGYLFIDGEQRDFFTTEILAGLVAIVLIAFAADAVLVLARRLLTPWLRAREVSEP